MDSFILVLAGIIGFYMAWTIGANDAANAFATSVGSKAIRFRTAVVISGIFEFLGAVLVGSGVTNTIRKGIVDCEVIDQNPDLYILGMLCALLASAIWLHLATFLGLPVSTTHAIVGAVGGYGIVVGGFMALQYGTLLKIVLSWIISPLSGCLLAYLLFILLVRLVFAPDSPRRAMQKFGPWIAGATIFVLCISLRYKGMKNLSTCASARETFLYSILLSVVAGVVYHVILKKTVRKNENQYRYIERLFGYLQIITAASVAFAHGANDVANAIGPLAGIAAVVKSKTFSFTAPVPFWALVIGGVGIAFGVMTYGYRVIKVVGEQITNITPSRGFSAELATALTVLTFSRLGLPVSTTHTLVGSVMGVGLARGFSALNLGQVKKIVYSWVVTVPVVGVIAAVLFMILRFLVKI